MLILDIFEEMNDFAKGLCLAALGLCRVAFVLVALTAGEWFLLASPASAVLLENTLDCFAKDDLPVCSAVIRNIGNEFVEDVHAEIEFGDSAYNVVTRDQILAREILQIPRGVRLEPRAPGRYPVIFRLFYRDQDGNQLSAVRAKIVQVGNPLPKELDVGHSNITFYHRAQGDIAVVNRGDRQIDLSLKLIFPKEFELISPAPGSVEHLTLRAGENASVSIEFDKGNAPLGSKYDAYVVVEGKRENVSEAAVGKLALTVVGYAERSRPFQMTMIIIATCCILLIAVSFLRKMQHR